MTFLEETFSAATAPPEHRFHQKAARAVLKALLPESGTDIKGHMRSREELLGSVGLCRPSQGLRPTASASLTENSDSSRQPTGRDRRGFHFSGRIAEEVLPVDPRLLGSLVAGLADQKTEGNSPGPGGASFGGTCGDLECQAGEPAFARLVGVSQHPAVRR